MQLEFVRPIAIPSARTEPALLVRRLFAGLTGAQRAEICFDWSYRDAEKNLLRAFIGSDWRVTWPSLRERGFFSDSQRAMASEIFCSLLDPEWAPLLRRSVEDEDQHIAIIGDPESGNWQIVLTAGDMVMRTGREDGPETAFGGPISYGHAPHGFWEKPGHPGNMFWPQAQAASRLFNTLDLPARSRAVVDDLPAQPETLFRRQPEGLPLAGLGIAQKHAFEDVLATLLAPFRAADQASVKRCLAAQGGVDALHIAFSREHRLSAPSWDTWRLEGPGFLWHFQGFPHVQCWAHVTARR